MTTSRKVLIDRLVGVPLILLLNLLARVLGKLLRLNHLISPDQVAVIVVAKFFGLGSILQSTPMLAALRRHFPKARLVFLTSQANAPLIERLEGVDLGLYVDDRSLVRLALSTLRAVLRLIRLRAAWYFDLEVYSAYASIMALLSLARNRCGLYRRSAEFKKGICTHLLYFNTQKPIRAIYLQLAAAAGAEAMGDAELGRLAVRTGDEAGLLGKFPALSDSRRRLIVINPNASDLLLERRWPAPQFAVVMAQLLGQGHQLAVIGSRAEAGYVAELLARLEPAQRRGVLDTAGRLELGELLALLRRADCVITNDTGPMHVAVALQRPTVCLFGPVNPLHYGFDRPNIRWLHHPIYCSPCAHETNRPPCEGNNVCMRLIQPSEVLAAVAALLAAAVPGGGPSPAAGGARRLDATAVGATREGGTLQPLGLVLSGSVNVFLRAPCPVCGHTAFARLPPVRHWLLHGCRGCGLERIDPQPSEATLRQAQTRHAEEDQRVGEAALRTIKRRTLGWRLESVGPLPAQAPILDCGAAGGYLLELAAERLLEPYGVELAAAAADHLARRYGAERIQAGAFEAAVFDRTDFAAVFMCDFLEHTREPVAALAKAHGLLGAGGWLVVATPDTRSWSRRLMGPHWLHYKPEHLHYFNRTNLALLLAQAGFEVVRTEPAWKAMNLDYVLSRLRADCHWLLTPLLTLLATVIPARLHHVPVPVRFGEMLVVARKSSRQSLSGPGRKCGDVLSVVQAANGRATEG